jgi:16S rRNA (cytosine1402-N4)-methyltransferase
MNSGRGEETSLPAGGPARHVPVLLDEAVGALAPRPDCVYLDGTFGAGGYTRAILATPGARVIALDRDPDAIAGAARLVAEAGDRLILRQARFGQLDAAARAAGFDAIDGVVLDIGVSSMQLDEAARGFSFRFEGPLDMRMERSGRSAADIVNEGDEAEIADILFHYGEERLARRIARAIVADRQTKPFTTTAELAGLIARISPLRPHQHQIHPATRSFQGLRIAVNDELGELARALAAAEAILRPGGALVIVSFHSLEDRIVKQFFAERSGRGRARSRLLPGEPVPPAPTFECPPPQPMAPSEAETRTNPRARSARLRFGRRTQAPALGLSGGFVKLAALPDRQKKGR